MCRRGERRMFMWTRCVCVGETVLFILVTTSSIPPVGMRGTRRWGLYGAIASTSCDNDGGHVRHASAQPRFLGNTRMRFTWSGTRTTFLHHHLGVNLLELGSFDFLGPEESDETIKTHKDEKRERNELVIQPYEWRPPMKKNLRHVRPKMSSPTITIFACGFLLVEHELDTLANSSQGFLEHGHLLVPRHIITRSLEVFLYKGRGVIPWVKMTIRPGQ